MLSDRTIFGLIVIVYSCLLLAHLWPYLVLAWHAYSVAKPFCETPRPAKDKVLTGGLAFLSGVLWTWLYFRN